MGTLSWHAAERKRSRTVAALFAFSLIATSLLRVNIITAKNSFSHDEAISFLSATCHQGAYSRLDFGFAPVPASEWKALLQVDNRFCFEQISADLGRSDIHPPLYFWLLHLWSLIWGVDVWTGPFLNTLIALSNILVLYALAREVTRRRAEATLVTFSYALNYSVVAISGLARQYDLLAFLTLLLVWIGVRCATLSGTSWRYAFALFILTAAGMMTHYHFFLPVTGTGLFLTIKLFRRNPRALAIALGSIGMGGLATLFVHPYVLSASGRQMGNLGVFLFTPESFAFRLMKLAVSFAAFYYVILPAAVLCILSILKIWRSPQTRSKRWRQLAVKGRSMLFFSGWLAGGVTLLYLTSITPLHQMGPKYFAMAWPFLSFLPVFVLRAVRNRRSVVLALYLFPLVISLALSAQGRVMRNQQPDPGVLLGEASMILVDNITRGIFPRIAWHIPDSSLVIAAEQKELLSQPDSWMNQLTEEFTYVSEVSYASTVEGQMEIVALLERGGYSVIRVASGLWDDGTVFDVRKTVATQ